MSHFHKGTAREIRRRDKTCQPARDEEPIHFEERVPSATDVADSCAQTESEAPCFATVRFVQKRSGIPRLISDKGSLHGAPLRSRSTTAVESRSPTGAAPLPSRSTPEHFPEQ